MSDQDVSVRHDEQARQFVVVIDGSPSAAVLKYRRIDDETLDYYSTFTPPELRGRGLAAQIVTTALDYALDKGLRVVPTCPYVAKLIERHDEYRPLVG